MAVAIEPTHEGNIHDGAIAFFQQLLCPFNALLEQILIRGCADRLLKQVTEMKLAHIQQRS